jgi:hypothetical protein
VNIARQQSAYILVYDRVSTNIAVSAASTSVAAPMTRQPSNPAAALDYLFAPACAQFILKACREALAMFETDDATALDGFKLACRFFVDVLCRAAPASRRLVVKEWAGMLVLGAASLASGSRWLVETLSMHADEETGWVVGMLFRCPDRFARLQFAELVEIANNRLTSQEEAGEGGILDLNKTAPMAQGEQVPQVYLIQGQGPVSRVAWLLDALLVCASTRGASDEFFDLVLRLARIPALTPYLIGHGAAQTFADLYIRSSTDEPMKRMSSFRHTTAAYRKKQRGVQQAGKRVAMYPQAKSDPLAELVVHLALAKPDLLVGVTDGLIDAASRRRHDKVAARLAMVLWLPSSVLAKLLESAKARPIFLSVVYEYALLVQKQGEVAVVLINAVDEMLNEVDDSFFNLYVFHATRTVYRLQASGSSAVMEALKGAKKKTDKWQKSLAKKLDKAVG